MGSAFTLQLRGGGVKPSSVAGVLPRDADAADAARHLQRQSGQELRGARGAGQEDFRQRGERGDSVA